METIVEDIRRTTANGNGKGHLDLLVITHEHWDHLSGFIYARAKEAWEQIQVENLWLGWTADHERDGLAEVLQRVKDLQQQALAVAAEQALRLGLEDRLKTVSDLSLFLADKKDAPDRSLAGGLEHVKKLARSDCVYCRPGEVRPVPGANSIAYVLGPPRQWNFLSRMNPSESAPETYDNALALGGELFLENVATEDDQIHALRRLLDAPSPFNAFVQALQARPVAEAGSASAAKAGSAPEDVYYRSFPFDRAFRIPLAMAESEAANAPGQYPALDSYLDSVNQWRRIDDDWLMAAETFALVADNFVNNTSLVLAFELPPAAPGADRNVLLFVADAQVGNWLSWDTIECWTPRDGAMPTQQLSQPDIKDLLARTVFYKVGHHGSHNATLKANGVERMRDDGKLTAFVPVSAAVAKNVGWDEMPLAAMLDALSARTRGRVVLPNADVWPQQPGGAPGKATDLSGVTVSIGTLEAKPSGNDPAGLEGEVPLWVQVAVPY
jgi:hypothetical protein